MVASTIIAPLNSLIFVHGSKNWRAPVVQPELSMVWATASSVASACYPEIDGPTQIVLGLASDIIEDGVCVFDGIIETHNLIVEITTVGSTVPILQQCVGASEMRVRVWHSHPVWPKIVTISLG